MASSVIVIKHTDKMGPLKVGAKHGNLQQAINFLQSLISGAKQASFVDIHQNATTDPVAASGTVTISSGSGTITATIGGVAISITWATTDANSAALLAAAINANTNALIAGLISASSAVGVVTVSAKQKGALGNHVTLAASGTGATASGARLTGGTGGNVSATTVTL